MSSEAENERAVVGDNSATVEAAAQLKNVVERIERLEEEKKAVGDDIKSVYAEAKAVGFDTKVLRKLIALRKMDPDERAEQDALLESYLSVLGAA